MEDVKKIVTFDAALRREIKATAKLRIMMRLPLCAAAAAAYLLPALLVAMLTAVPADASLERMLAMFGLSLACEVLLLGAIMMGLQYFLVDISRGQCPAIAVVFSPLGSMREMLRGVRMMLCMMFRMMLMMIIPTAIYMGALYLSIGWMERQGAWDDALFAQILMALVTVYLLLILPTLGRLASYVIGYSLLRDDPNIGVWRATREGSRLLRGHRRAMLAFALSFLPWWFAGFLTCGLSTAFGMIYLCVSLYVLADRLRGMSNLPENDSQNNA